MDLNNLFLFSELIVLWMTAVLALWQFKWDREDRIAKAKAKCCEEEK